MPHPLPDSSLIDPRRLVGRVLLALLPVVLAALAAPSASAAPPLRLLAPAEAVALLYVDDFPACRDKVEKIAWSQLWNSPPMQAFRRAVESQEQSAEETLKSEYGFGYGEIFDAEIEQLALLTLETTEADVSLSMAARFSSPEQAQAFAESAMAELERRGGERQTLELEGPASRINLPRNQQHVVYVIRDACLLVSGDQGNAERLLKRWPFVTGAQADDGSSLWDAAAPKYILQATAGESPAEVQWFVDVVRLSTLTYEPPADLNSDEDLDERPPFPQRHGFPQVQGAGGQIWLGQSPFDYLTRTALYKPGADQEVIRSFDFPPGDVDVEDSVPAEVSTSTVIRWNLQKLFTHIGPLVNDVMDTPQYWEEVMSDIKQDYGVDMQNELAPKLGPRMTLTSIYAPEQKSEKTLVAIDIQGGPAAERYVATTLFRMFQKDSKARRIKLPGQTYELWETRFRVGGNQVAFSKAGWMVARNKLWISTHSDWIRDNILRRQVHPLNQDDEFVRTGDPWKQHAAADCFLQMYARTDLDFEFTYETLRTGGLDGLKKAENLYGNLLLQAMEQFDIQIDTDFSTLPKFDDIRRYFGVTRAVGRRIDQGWLFVLGGHRSPQLDSQDR